MCVDLLTVFYSSCCMLSFLQLLCAQNVLWEETFGKLSLRTKNHGRESADPSGVTSVLITSSRWSLIRTHPHQLYVYYAQWPRGPHYATNGPVPLNLRDRASATLCIDNEREERAGTHSGARGGMLPLHWVSFFGSVRTPARVFREWAVVETFRSAGS